MESKGFIFDYSKCVACHACLVACYNENHTQPPISWRQVQSYNKLKVPLYGFINLSIACNHCKDAPCLKACPAKAYHKDSLTGAIFHTADKCIGCTYCTWACPFDAPNYSAAKGVVEKCNFCNDRLKAGAIPACTNACPTGALSFGSIEVSEIVVAPGMSNKPTSPRANFLNSDVVNSKPQMDLGASGFNSSQVPITDVKPKINAIKEWPLVIFTLLSSLLVGWIVFLLFNPSSTNYGYYFIGLGLLGMGLSSLHLGKPFRAYRSIFNIKTSWLSREILFYSLFVGLSSIVFLLSSNLFLILLTVLVGVLLLIAIEYVYSVADKNYKTIIHSANTLLTAVTFGFLLTNYNSISIGLIALKGVLYITRYAYKDSSITMLGLGLIRFFLGILIPLVCMMILNTPKFVIFFPFVVAELIDRFEYYNNLHIDTPLNLLSKSFSKGD
ncbi:MAG TPA: dimethyl sulfoxide reductase anchor subunit [Tenuifilaceae bacterium]|nr:dimethyl sulfoxide reductase anchor subunit [Tenuifilaceae bacterium]